MTPETLGSSTNQLSSSNSLSSDNKNNSTNPETDFIQNYIKDYLSKHTTCVHFLETPISLSGVEHSIINSEYSIIVKQLHLDIPINLTLPPSATLSDVISEYEKEMARIKQIPIPTVDQRWLYKGKPLLNPSITLSSITSGMEITFHLVRKVSSMLSSKSESELLQALRSFESERSTGNGSGHLCSDPRCASSISFLLGHLKE